YLCTVCMFIPQGFHPFVDYIVSMVPYHLSIRGLCLYGLIPFVHSWTSLQWFNTIGPFVDFVSMVSYHLSLRGLHLTGLIPFVHSWTLSSWFHTISPVLYFVYMV